jgi:cyclase
MLKKRLIFTLLYNNGHFIQSRNFRLQKVGDVNWLINNYDFKNIAQAIDELVIVNVGRNRIMDDQFFNTVQELSQKCFMPKAFGGAINNLSDAQQFINAGADKVIVNSVIFSNPQAVRDIVDVYGSQAVVGCIDCRFNTKKNEFEVVSLNGSKIEDFSLEAAIDRFVQNGVGEVNLQSIDQDGTGMGLDLRLVQAYKKVESAKKVPLVLSGGAGNFEHIKIGFEEKEVNAVSTANLLNFMGDSLRQTRKLLISTGVNLPSFEME